MYLFFWEREGRRIMIITGWVILLIGVIIGVIKLAGIPRQVTAEGIEQQSPKALQTPLTDPPLVTYVEGFPEGKKENSGTWELLEAGSELGQGSIVRTDGSSYLDIRMQPGTVIRVMENTIFSLEAFYEQKVEVHVEKGTIIARVARLISTQTFNFLAPSVVAGIRGTELIVSTATKGTTVFGMSGKIELFNPEFPDKKVFVSLHEKSFTKNGGVPNKAVMMSPEEIEQYRKLLDSLRDNPVFIVGDNITFLPNSVQLTPEALAAVETIYKQLLSVQGNIKVVGHTADIGAPEAQIALSKGRAQAVIDYLVKLGFPGSRLSAVGLGSKQPVSSDSSTMDKNRRVEFVIEQE